MKTITVKDLQESIHTDGDGSNFDCGIIECSNCIFQIQYKGKLHTTCGGRINDFDWLSIKEASFKRRVDVSIKDVIKFSKNHKLEDYKTD